MLGRVFKPILSFNGRAIRRHTVSASFTHSVLPASLLRLNPSQNFRLLPFELEALNKRAQNQVSQSMGNDLRNPDTWIHYVPLSGLSPLLPNTFWMQEVLRTACDSYLDSVDAGITTDVPFVFTIPKGTPLPEPLTLLRTRPAEFCIGATSSVSNKSLVDALDEFFSSHAIKEDADAWLGSHEFQNAVADEEETKWMSQ